MNFTNNLYNMENLHSLNKIFVITIYRVIFKPVNNNNNNIYKRKKRLTVSYFFFFF